MKNTFGNAISLTIFGESHGPYIGVVIDGIAPGLDINEQEIADELTLRRPSGSISTTRKENDLFVLASGVFNGKTTGTPLTILIPNENTKSGDYSYGVARPSHADYSAYSKYHGFEDYRGGGHFSGRITAALVAAGAIFRSALKKKGILLGTHILELKNTKDTPLQTKEQIEILHSKQFPVLSDIAQQEMTLAIEEVAKEGDSIGGLLETLVLGVPAGLGEPFFDSVESELSHALFSIPAVKGVLFGSGLDFAKGTGSELNDQMTIEEGSVSFLSNHNGGICGGITNGAPIRFTTIVKPTPSIYKTQNSINFTTNEKAELQIKGRHDPAIIHRARIVVDAMTSFVLCDLLTTRFGTDYLAKEDK